MNRCGCFAAVAVVAGLQACSGMRATTAALEVPPPVAEIPAAPPVAAESNGPPSSPSETTSPDMTNENAQPPGANALANCVAPETKPKPEVKPRPVRKPPPQQPPPSATATPEPEALVDAQVKPMAVPVLSILGRRVKGLKGEDLGRVVDVLTDASGRVRIAVVDFGGFLGVGDRRIAVEWRLLRFNPEGGDAPVTLRIGQDKLKVAPEYKDSVRPLTLMEPVAAEPPPISDATAPADSKK
jgi:PRC-barrel domain